MSLARCNRRCTRVVIRKPDVPVQGVVDPRTPLRNRRPIAFIVDTHKIPHEEIEGLEGRAEAAVLDNAKDAPPAMRFRSRRAGVLSPRNFGGMRFRDSEIATAAPTEGTLTLPDGTLPAPGTGMRCTVDKNKHYMDCQRLLALKPDEEMDAQCMDASDACDAREIPLKSFMFLMEFAMLDGDGDGKVGGPELEAGKEASLIDLDGLKSSDVYNKLTLEGAQSRARLRQLAPANASPRFRVCVQSPPA